MRYALCQACEKHFVVEDAVRDPLRCPTCGHGLTVLGVAIVPDPPAPIQRTEEERRYARGIYQELDILTGGIEAFIARGPGYAIWTSSAFMPFTVECVGDRRMVFGFHFEQNGDLVPDPWIWVTLGAEAADLDTLATETMFGAVRGSTPQNGAVEHAYELLGEINKRQRAGILTADFTHFAVIAG